MSVFALVCAGVSAIAHEIASQPEAWAEAARLAPRLAGVLPEPGERIAVVGCGTSAFMAQAYASLRESTGHGETDAFPASEMPGGRRYHAILAISRSGTTTEVLRLLKAADVRSVAITAVASSPIARAADDSVELEFADERSVVQTRFATTTLALLRAHMGQDLARAIADAELAVRADLPMKPQDYDHFVFLGTGWTVGLAHEAALKMREASGSFTESYPAMEYRHGPISLAGRRSVVWSLGQVDDRLLEDVAATGARVVTGRLDPMAGLIEVQRTAAALAELRGLDPDHPRHLTRSVVLS
jgi:fructoselysine-6-P-deglycase FrlB-like protein